MEYYTIRLKPTSQAIYNIITPRGNYKYLGFPMGIMCAPDIFKKICHTDGGFIIYTCISKQFVISV